MFFVFVLLKESCSGIKTVLYNVMLILASQITERQISWLANDKPFRELASARLKRQLDFFF